MASRQSKRRMERNKTLYKLTNNFMEEQQFPSDEEVQKLIKAIEIDSQAKFGLVQLSRLYLNQIYDGKTMLELACEKDRDFIVFNLFRGGANPTISMDNPKGIVESEKIIGFLRQKWPAFSCWIIKFITNLRKTSFKSTCAKCDTETKVLRLKCFDIICENCFWNSVVLNIEFDDPVCCICNAPLAEIDLDDNDDKIITIAESKRLFDALPDKVSKNGGKKEKFQALSLLTLNNMYLGSTKDQRLNVFFKCCLTGNASKLRNVIIQGIDINHRNEYGQTGLFIAAWKQKTAVIEVLRDFNADMGISDHASTQITPDLKILPSCGFEPLRGTVTNLKCPILEMDAFLIDNGFTEEFLTALEDLLDKLPVAKAQKAACSDRLYYSDATEWVSKSICNAIRRNLENHLDPFVMPDMRFLWYKAAGGFLPPHIDLSRTNEDGITSTHTFIIYLRNVEQGGETVLLERVPKLGHEGTLVSSITPKRGRLFCFPHISPHEGRAVVDVPKILLRGEINLTNRINVAELK